MKHNSLPLQAENTGKLENNIYPQRVVSVVPSQTELLYHLGLEIEVVGVTRFCVHPFHWRKTKAIVGGTKNLNVDKIKLLEPDLVIANKEENKKEQIEAIQSFCTVWTTDVKDIPSALEMISWIGRGLNRETSSDMLVTELKSSLVKIKPYRTSTALYLIWRNPWMGVGDDTFIHHMMEVGGYLNVLKGKQRYPVLTGEMIKSLSPEVILLSSEPYPFREKHVAELEAIVPRSNVMFVDGKAFSWYGSRMKQGLEYLKALAKRRG